MDSASEIDLEERKHSQLMSEVLGKLTPTIQAQSLMIGEISRLEQEHLETLEQLLEDLRKYSVRIRPQSDLLSIKQEVNKITQEKLTVRDKAREAKEAKCAGKIVTEDTLLRLTRDIDILMAENKEMEDRLGEENRNESLPLVVRLMNWPKVT